MKVRLPKRLKDGRPIDPETAKAVRKIQDDAALNSGSKYRLHVYHVFNDPDFDKDVREIRKLLESFYYKDISLNPDSDHLLKEHKQALFNFAARYCIDPEDLRTYADGLYDEGAGYGSDIDEFGGLMETGRYGLVYKIGPKTTLEQIQAEWKMHIEYAKQDYYGKRSGKKRLSKFNHELVYAVFKARNKPKPDSFTKIQKDYEQGTLAGYTGSRHKYVVKDDLERFYNKHKPYVNTAL